MSAWRKLGLRVPAQGVALQQTHAMLPTPHLMDDRIRVFFAACDSELRGRIFYADLSREFPHPLLSISRKPSLDLGRPEEFDADGVNPSSLLVGSQGELILYYIGWKRGDREIPYTLIAGMAFSTDDGQTFRRECSAILPPTQEEPFFRTAPLVWRSGSDWKMLYIGGGQFFNGPTGKRLPIYALRSATSFDGVTWLASPTPLLEPDPSKGEIGFGRPVLWHDPAGNPTLMLSKRTVTGYLLVERPWSGFKLIEGTFLAALEPGPDKWDSEMTCFGSPLKVGEHELLFYNGNRFGWTGFGLAWRPASGTFNHVGSPE